MTGTYTEIFEVVAPYQADPGSSVGVMVKVKNLYSSALTVMVRGELRYGIVPYPYLYFTPEPIDIPAGDWWAFWGSFIMPGAKTTLYIVSYYKTVDAYFNADDSILQDIAVPAPTVPAISEFKISDYMKV